MTFLCSREFDGCNHILVFEFFWNFKFFVSVKKFKFIAVAGT